MRIELQQPLNVCVIKGIVRLSKNDDFKAFESVLQIFFSGNIGQEYVFYDILEGKNAFLGYKNKKSKKSKN